MAAAASFRKEPGRFEKALWIFAFLVLMVAEVWMMGKDRTAHDKAERDSQQTAQQRFDQEMQRMEGIVSSNTKIASNTDQLLLKRVVPPPLGIKPRTYVQFDSTALVVSIVKQTPFVANEEVHVNFYYSNKTGVPAHAVSADGLAAVYEGGPAPNSEWENSQFAAFKARWKAEGANRPVNDLGSGENWFTRFVGPLTTEDVALLQEGKKLLYVFGIIGWKDGSGSHETELCSILQPPGTAPVWHNCPSGHNIIH